MWCVKAIVKLKEGVLDVQGRAVEAAMKQVGYFDVKDVKIGKYIEFFTGQEPAKEKLEEIGEKLGWRIADRLFDLYSGTTHVVNMTAASFRTGKMWGQLTSSGG